MSKKPELFNAAIALCAECGSEMIGDATRLSCNHCGLIDRHPTPAVETIPNMCRNPQCMHPMTGEHDALGCHAPGCLCTETRQAIETPEDALSNAAPICSCDAGDNEKNPSEHDGRCAIYKASFEKSNAETKHDPADGQFTSGGGGGSSSSASSKRHPDAIRADFAKHRESAAAASQAQDEAAKETDPQKRSEKMKAAMSGHGNRREEYSRLEKEWGDTTGNDWATGKKRENSNADPRAAFEAHAKECEGCTNAYSTGAAETMCANGVSLMNAGSDKQIVLEEIAKLEKEIAAFRAAPKSPENDKTLQAKETTLAGLRRELGNADKFAKGGDEFGKPGGTVTMVNSEPQESEWKDKSDYNPDGGCKKCKWGAPGTGHSSGYHKNDCGVLKKERDLYAHFQGAERRNSAPARACINGEIVEEFRGRR